MINKTNIGCSYGLDGDSNILVDQCCGRCRRDLMLRTHIYTCARLIHFDHSIDAWLWILYEAIRYESCAAAATATAKCSCATNVCTSTAIFTQTIVFGVHWRHLCWSIRLASLTWRDTHKNNSTRHDKSGWNETRKRT